MAYASQSGRARVSAKNPQAFAVCQRCGMWYNRVNLQFQNEWRGTSLQNIWILVCKDCLDTPQEQLRAIVLPADPTPVFYPSIENFDAADSDYRATSQIIPPDPVTGIPLSPTTLRITEDGINNRTTLPYGQPVGLTQAAVMPYNGGQQQAYGVPLQLLSVTSDGSDTVTVTCSAVHNLQTDYQISVAGLAYLYANGFYSVTVLTATAFSYVTYSPIPAQALLRPTSRIITTYIGLPRGYQTIPQIYTPTVPQALAAADNAFALEDNSGAIVLEDGTTFMGLE